MGIEFPTGYYESFLFLLFLNDKETSNLGNKVKDAQNEGSSSLGPIRLHGDSFKLAEVKNNGLNSTLFVEYLEEIFMSFLFFNI